MSIKIAELQIEITKQAKFDEEDNQTSGGSDEEDEVQSNKNN